MLGRLISTIVFLVLLALFAGFNLENKCNVNLLFHTFESVPVFFTIIFSFVAGIIFTLPFVLFNKKKGTEKKDGETEIASKKAEKKVKKISLFGKKMKGKISSEQKNPPMEENAAVVQKN